MTRRGESTIGKLPITLTCLLTTALTITPQRAAQKTSKTLRKEFKGKVKTIDARPFWRSKDASPSGSGRYSITAAEFQTNPLRLLIAMNKNQQVLSIPANQKKLELVIQLAK